VTEVALREHGAVSEWVVRQMVEGALKVSGADIAVAVSGIAGPDGGTPDKPVGIAWLAWAVKGGETRVLHRYSPRNRLDFKLSVSQDALDGIRRLATI
jgi:PncC family amidohydrolase